MEQHKFSIGDHVQSTERSLTKGGDERFVVTRLLPEIQGEPCYHVRGDSEKFERVFREGQMLLAPNAEASPEVAS